MENLRSAYRQAMSACEDRYKLADLERLQLLCERVLIAMEQWHRRTVQELREAHARELQLLRQDKEQALAEETQATLAALDAMRKAHEAEVQREVARFKQEFVRQQRDELRDLSERLSVKCLEAAALEEQLGSATRQLAHAQQHILQLERNPQLSTVQVGNPIYTCVYKSNCSYVTGDKSPNGNPSSDIHEGLELQGLVFGDIGG